MSTLDLTFLSICRINGQEWPVLPGLLAINPPPKPARGRDQDRLLVYLTLTGNLSYSTSEYAEIVGQVGETFYNTPGSLTFALKSAASALNTSLVEGNMKSTSKGLYSTGALVLCTLRGNSMYIVQAGPTHVYHLAAEVRHLYDPELAGKGLGLSQNARMYFSQVTLSPGDRLLMCAALPPNWDKSLTESRGSASLEITRRRLLAITNTNVSALLVLATEGSGVMKTLKALQDETSEPAKAMVPALELIPGAQPASLLNLLAEESVSGRSPVSRPQALEEPVQESQDSLLAPQETVRTAIPSPEPQPASESPRRVPIGRPFRQSELPDAPAPQAFDDKLREAARSLARSIQSGRVLLQKGAAWAERVIPNLLPESEDEQPIASVSRTAGIFFAIAIPILLFVIARIVYYQLGYEAQHSLYFTRAQQSAQQALTETSPSAARVEWQATLDWLDKADLYTAAPGADSLKFRQDAQLALDRLDHVVRIAFTPAFTTIPDKSVHVSHISASNSEVYFLDSGTGSVTRGLFNGIDYDVDRTFLCKPGLYNDNIQVGSLIDIVALQSSGSNNATLLGIDGSGNLLYCSPGADPHAAALQMPATGWKGITAISYDDDTLYVLDAPARGVWFYAQATKKLEFTGEPSIFFGTQIPVGLQDAIGLVVNHDDLYLLHKDGHMATCAFSQSRCTDPAMYVDSRPGYEGGLNLSDGVFTQIALTSAPDSLALLEPFSQSIFRFSPRSLELQDQLQVAPGKGTTLPKGMPVQAMAFSPNKILFVYVDGQLYFSNNAP